MAPQCTIKVDCTPCMQYPGSTIAGQVHIDLGKVIEDHLEECVVKLKGSINTMIEVHNGNNSSNRYRGYLVLLQNQAILWRLAESPLAGGKISVPFQLTFPRTNNLPPSFHSSGRHWSGTVQYYVKVVGVRTGMFRRNFRIIVNLPYLPLSSRAFPPQTLDLPTWKGQWGTFKNVEQMRRGLWGGHGRVETELWTPFIDRIPLFRPFPIQLRVATYSKLLPHSASHNPSTYEFPLFTPAPTSVSVSLVLQVNVVAQALFSRPLRKSVGPGESVGHLIGGFGVKPGDTAWAKDVIMDSSQSNATWTVLPDDKSGDSGRWKTDTVFQSVVTFHDPPTWATDILSWEYFIKVVIPFPGIGNNVKFSAGPIVLASSVESPSDTEPGPSRGVEPPPSYYLDLPPAYWERDADNEDGDEKSGEK